jgi:hypothetical protein
MLLWLIQQVASRARVCSISLTILATTTIEPGMGLFAALPKRWRPKSTHWHLTIRAHPFSTFVSTPHGGQRSRWPGTITPPGKRLIVHSRKRNGWNDAAVVDSATHIKQQI